MPDKQYEQRQKYYKQKLRQKDIENTYVFKKVHQIHTFDYPPYSYFELYIMPLID